MLTRLDRHMRAHPGPWVLGGLCPLMFIPGLDLAVSGAFYTPGEGFAWERGGLPAFVREAVPAIILGGLLFCLILWLAGLLYRQWFWGMTTPRVVYLITTLVIGPGLLVETLLKPYWGRARPNDLVLFGGHAAHSPPWWIANQCVQNCAFVSGHAALGFWLTAYGFLLPERWRARGILVGLLCGAGMGLARIGQGAHFLSDVVFAGAIVLTVNAVLARLFLSRLPRLDPA